MTAREEEVLDATDMDMIRSGDRLGPKLGAKVARILEGIEELRGERGKLREALEWYGENARLCRLIHSEGDTGRNALAKDGGNRAREALKAAQ